MTTAGEPTRASPTSLPPRSCCSSSRTTLVTCCAGENAVSTSSPTAFSRTRLVNSLTTLKWTSASRSATRISFSAFSMCHALRLASPRRVLKTRSILSCRLSNIRVPKAKINGFRSRLPVPGYQDGPHCSENRRERPGRLLCRLDVHRLRRLSPDRAHGFLRHRRPVGRLSPTGDGRGVAGGAAGPDRLSDRFHRRHRQARHEGRDRELARADQRGRLSLRLHVRVIVRRDQLLPAGCKDAGRFAAIRQSARQEHRGDGRSSPYVAHTSGRRRRSRKVSPALRM